MSSSSSAPSQGALRRLAPRLACAARRAASRSTPRVVAAAGAKKGKGKDEAASVYKETVNLPKTSFGARKPHLPSPAFAEPVLTRRRPARQLED